MSKEAIVGLLVSVACLILLGLSPGRERRAPILGDNYELLFHNVEGLRVGDAVVVGGVEEGKVASLDFDKDKFSDGLPVVVVKIAVANGLSLPSGTNYKVVSDLRGRRMINMVPGAPGPPLPRGSRLTAELAPEQEDSLSKTLRTFKTLAQQTEGVRKEFADANFRRETKDMASNMRFYSREFLASSANAPAQLKAASRQIDLQEARLRRQISQVDAQVDAVSARLHQIAPGLKSSLGDYATKIDQMQKQVDGLVTLADVYVKEVDRYNHDFQDKVTSKIPKDLGQKVHEAAQKLDDYEAIMEDGHTLFLDDKARAGYKKRIADLKERTVKLKEQIRKFDESVDKFPVKP